MHACSVPGVIPSSWHVMDATTVTFIMSINVWDQEARLCWLCDILVYIVAVTCPASVRLPWGCSEIPLLQFYRGEHYIVAFVCQRHHLYIALEPSCIVLTAQKSPFTTRRTCWLSGSSILDTRWWGCACRARGVPHLGDHLL